MKLNVKEALGIFLFVFFIWIQPVSTSAISVNAYFFYGEGCPHCAQEKKYLLQVLKVKYPSLQIREYEIYNNRDNALFLLTIAKNLGFSVDGVPLLIIGDKQFVGYADNISPPVIEQRVKECLAGDCNDSIYPFLGEDILDSSQPDNKQNNDFGLARPQNIQENDDLDELPSPQELINKESKDNVINLPFLGEVNIMKFSLPILTIIMGALDGFNPCAMWTLLFLISLLLGMRNRKRMWILGFAFIVASASVYFFFMVAWLNFVLFLGFVIWTRVFIGILAFLAGAYSIKEFIFNKDSGCKVAGDKKRQKIFDKLRLAVQQNSLWLALAGIIVLAFAVNLVELICSAGLPAVYTQVLALNEMANWRYYFYILLYIFFFMLDDLFIFFLAMITLEMAGVTTKYARASRLIGGLVMLAIGLMLIFKPEWLMFG